MAGSEGEQPYYISVYIASHSSVCRQMLYSGGWLIGRMMGGGGGVLACDVYPQL